MRSQDRSVVVLCKGLDFTCFDYLSQVVIRESFGNDFAFDALVKQLLDRKHVPVAHFFFILELEPDLLKLDVLLSVGINRWEKLQRDYLQFADLSDALLRQVHLGDHFDAVNFQQVLDQGHCFL